MWDHNLLGETAELGVEMFKLLVVVFFLHGNLIDVQKEANTTLVGSVFLFGGCLEGRGG